ncbi:MAG: hypothetical protein HGB10_03780 [Coriobacteriia bacterium]|nr:hypothetical protein [Coriobacteriia bacterium]
MARLFMPTRRLLVVAVLAAMIGLVAPASRAAALDTAVFSNPVPAAGATVLAKPIQIKVDVDDVAMITGATVTLNGVPALFVARDHYVGHSEYDEESESDYWAVDDWSVARVTGSFSANNVALGVNTVVTRVTSSAGVSTYTRTFSYGNMTTISTVSPSPSSVLPASPASVTVGVITGSTGFSTYSLKIDGTTVPMTYTAGTKTFRAVLGSALSPGLRTCVFTARDLQGTNVSRTWSFTVSPPMSNGDQCTVCHTTYPAAHAVSGCEACHDHGYDYPYGDHGEETPTAAGCTGGGIDGASDSCHKFDHGGADFQGSGPFACATCHREANSAVPQHTSAEVDAAHASIGNPNGCESCHIESLIDEHSQYPESATVKYQCDLCHGANAPQQVKDAVAAGNTSCSACHTTVTHGDHASTVADTALGLTGSVCGDCHATDLVDEHFKLSSSTFTNGCYSCHPTPRSTFVDWGRACTQGGCHTVGTSNEMHSGAASAHGVPAPGCTKDGCHDGGTDVSLIHATQGCLTCHEDDSPLTDCTGCHDMDSPHGDIAPQHLATMTYSSVTISGVSFGDHTCSECHGESGLTTIHGSADEDCMKCHPTPKSTLTPTWGKSCAQADCHTGSTATMHTSIDADHQPNTNDANCVKAGCHASSSVAKIHENAEGVVDGFERAGCQVCHAAGTPTGGDCVSCHPDRVDAHGYVVYRHEGTPATETVTIDSVVYTAPGCAACHETELGPEHEKATSSSSADGCGACHPSPWNTLAPAWDKTTCVQGGCHTESSAAPMHASATSGHVTSATNDPCFASGCHAASNLAALHANATNTVAEPARFSCMICHSEGVPTIDDCTNVACHADKAESHYVAADHLASPVAETISILGNSYGSHACADCHDLYLGAVHSEPTASSSDDGCAACHPSAAASLAGGWTGTCVQADCHVVSTSNAKHAGIDPAHETLSANSTCFSAVCHASSNLAALHSLATTMVAGQTRTSCEICHADGSPTNKDCTAPACHGSFEPPHRDPATDAAHTTSTTGCDTCHSAVLPTEHELHPASGTKYDCTICHGSGARPDAQAAVTAGDTACTACHAAPEDIPAHADIANSCTSCHDTFPAEHPITGCEYCHTSGWDNPRGDHGEETPNPSCTGDDNPYNNESGVCHSYDHGRFTCFSCHNTSNPQLPQHWTPVQ